MNDYWCIPSKEDADFVACMEDVLDVYELPYDPMYPGRNCSRDLPSRNWKRNGRPTRYFTLTSEQVLT